MKTKSGTEFVDEADAARWEELEADILVNDAEFRAFSQSQWAWLSRKVAPLINKALKGL